MTHKFSRWRSTFTANLNTAVGTTQEIGFQPYVGGVVIIPTGSSITSLTYHAAASEGGTYSPLQDSAGAAVTQTVAANEAIAMPDAVFGVQFLKIVTDASGTAEICLKS